MALTESQEKFLKLFGEYMGRHEKAYKPLSEFISQLDVEKVRQCVSSYFDVFKRYGLKDPYSLRVFHNLLLRGVKEDVYFALRYEALTSTKGNLAVHGEFLIALEN